MWPQYTQLTRTVLVLQFTVIFLTGAQTRGGGGVGFVGPTQNTKQNEVQALFFDSNTLKLDADLRLMWYIVCLLNTGHNEHSLSQVNYFVF